MKQRTSIMSRMFILLGLLFLLPFAIAIQLFRVNVVEGDGLRDLWNSQAIDYIEIPAQRGNIFDANGSLLATNSAVYKIAVDPFAPGTTRDDLKNVGTVLSRHTNRSASYYQNKIRTAPSNSRYIVLERSISVQAYEDIRALDIRGVILEEEYKRTYNFGTLSAHILGYVNHNIDGMTGLEGKYNKLLKGESGLQQVRRDRSNRIFAFVGAPRQQPLQGYSLHTTIDSYIQAIVEEELEEGIKRNMANHGSAIVIDPKTGAIKAMANYPTFDPNSPAAAESENRRNYAVSDMFEPGSTFKLVTAVAAVEQGVVDFDEIFETPENGRVQIHGQWMRDHDPLGNLTFKETIAKSSNIATSEIAMRLDPKTYYQYARNLGFGTPTNIDLNNEIGGRLQKPFEWSGVTLPWMSIGYEVQATSLQIAQAYAAFANGGELMKPYIVSHITDEYGHVLEKTNPSTVRRVASKSTIKKLQPIFEAVVTDSGTAEWAAVDGLRIAGKTGTAQKYINGRYTSNYRASFVGYFPVEEPSYVVLVMLDEPKTSYYGGFTAGAVFKEITTRIAGLDETIRKSFSPGDTFANSDSLITPLLKGQPASSATSILEANGFAYKISGSGSTVTGQTPAASEKIERNSFIELQLGNVTDNTSSDDMVTIPDLRNMNMRGATAVLHNLGLKIERIGSGTIYNQFPLAGEKMRPGRTVVVRGKAQSMENVTQMASQK
ncbi:penicillin-binding transpeptidase domain-containing protein [Rhodohalobacter sp. 8-1]|uniref:penicillin-binding transpeptidase domain-containing protein n=1 Tax=Rhodohalobacter sp. 8-1 TaxID=3131972 RepID=UPI0030ECB5A8